MGKEKGNGLGKFIAGAAIGVGVGVLLAPKSGKETRKDLKDKFDELVEKVKEINVDEVINILNNISHDGYYVKMGVAWCLCEIGIKYNKKFMKYMKSKDNKLDKFTYNKALQKMIESYRIDDCQKDILRQMKRKDK